MAKQDLRTIVKELVTSLIEKQSALPNRQVARYVFNAPVRVHADANGGAPASAFDEAWTTDISVIGMGFHARRQYQAGEIVHVGFEPSRITMPMRIVYSRATLPGVYRAGGAFVFDAP